MHNQIYLLILVFDLVTSQSYNLTTTKPTSANPETSRHVLHGVLIAFSVAVVLGVFVIIAIYFRMRTKENKAKRKKENSILMNIVEDQTD